VFAFLRVVVVLVSGRQGLIGRALGRARVEARCLIFARDRRVWRGRVCARRDRLVALAVVVDATLGRTWVRIIDVALALHDAGGWGSTSSSAMRDCSISDTSRLFRGRRLYFYALLASPQHDIHAPLLLLPPISALVARRFRRGAGGADAQNCAAIPGDRHARLRRNHSHLPEQTLNRPYNLTNGPQGITLVDPLARRRLRAQ